MCQSRRDGGVRCPIHRSDVMAALSIASRESGLSASQVKQVFHSLRREGRNTNISSSMRASVLTELMRRSNERESELLTDSAPNDGDSNSAVDYALLRLVTRATSQASKLETALQEVADRQGWTLQQAKEKFNQAYDSLGKSRNPVTLRENAPTDSTGRTSLDPSFLAAINKLNAAQERGERLIQSFVGLRRSEILKSVGYCPDNGRLEIENRLGTAPFVYHSVPEETYRGLLTSRSPDSFFLNSIRGRSEFAYQTPEAAEADAHTVKCAACGQFRAAAHQCPTRENAQQEELALLQATEDAELREAEEAQARVDARKAAMRTLEEQSTVTPPTAPSSPSQAPTNSTAEVLSADLPFAEAKGILEERRNPSLTYGRIATETYDSAVRMHGMWAYNFSTLSEEQQAEVRAFAHKHYEGRTADVNYMSIANIENGGWEYARPMLPGETVLRDSSGKSYAIPALSHYSIPSTDTNREQEIAEEKQAVQARIEKGSAVQARLSSRRTRSIRFTQGNDIANCRVATATEVKALMRAKKEIIIPFSGHITPPVTDHTGKVWRRTSDYGSRVQGHFGITVDKNGLAHVTTTARSLKCYCAVYRANYRCMHVEYAEAYMQNVAQQLLPIPTPPVIPGQPRARAPRRPAVVTPFGNIPAATAERLQISVVEASDGVPAYLAIREGETTPARRPYAIDLRERADILARSHGGSLTEEDWRALARYENLLSIRPSARPTDINQALKYGPVRVPLSHNSGSIILEKNDEGEVLIKHRDLKCYCDDYALNYDCVHVRAVDEEAVKNWLDTENCVANTGYQPSFPRWLRTFVRAVSATGITNPEEAVEEYNRQESDRLRLRAERHVQESLAKQEAERAVREGYQPHREKVSRQWKERNDPGYSEDDSSVFFAHYSEALALKKKGESPLEFKTSGVLDGLGDTNDPASRRFGVELEFDIDPSVDKRAALHAIGRDLHTAGLTETAQQVGYHSAEVNGWKRWSFEQDCTVDGEIVSPILGDTPEDWKQLQQVVQIVKKHGGRTTVRGGGHVHVSSGTYGESVAKHTELVRQMKEHQDALFRLASDPKRGKHRGQRWASANLNPSFSGDVPSDFNGNWYDASRLREGAVNIGASGDGIRGHVEFRLWDATLDEAVIQQHIKLSVAMTERAEQTVIEKGHSPARSGNAPIGAGKARETLVTNGDKKAYSAESFHKVNSHNSAFIGSLFRKNEDRKDIAALFAITNWQQQT